MHFYYYINISLEIMVLLNVNAKSDLIVDEKIYFSIKLTKIYKENQGRNESYFHGYNVTYAEFKTLQLHKFVETDQSVTKLCTRFFLNKRNKNMLKKQGWSFGLRSPLRQIKLTSFSIKSSETMRFLVTSRGHRS